MEEEKKPEIQEDEPLKEPQQEPETEVKAEEAAPETEKPSEETTSDKRHKGRRAHVKALEEAKAKYAELNDTYLRLYSEFDNYRKRTAKEKLELSATASAAVMRDLLPVLDDIVAS